MLLGTKIILTLAALCGLAYSLVNIFHRDRASESLFEKRRWRRIGLGLWTFWIALVNLMLVHLGYFGSFETLLGFVGLVSLGYAMSRVDLNDFFKQLGNVGEKKDR